MQALRYILFFKGVLCNATVLTTKQCRLLQIAKNTKNGYVYSIFYFVIFFAKISTSVKTNCREPVLKECILKFHRVIIQEKYYMGSVGETRRSVLVNNWEEMTQRNLNIVLFPNSGNVASEGVAVSKGDHS